MKSQYYEYVNSAQKEGENLFDGSAYDVKGYNY